MNKDTNLGTDTGAPDLTDAQKLDNLARNVFVLMEKLKEMGLALDNVYIQVATLIEVLAMDEKVLNPEIWEEKLKEVTQNIKDTMEAMTNESGTSGQGNGDDPNRSDETSGSGKIITPSSRIIIPGQ